MSIFEFHSWSHYEYSYYRHIPLTWTHTVAPYQPPLPNECIYTEDPTSFNFSSLGKTFNVIFINTPLNYDCSNFRKLAIGRKVIPTGCVFVWADKENIPTILNIFEEKGFFYVENLVWVQQHYEDTIEMNEVRVNGDDLPIDSSNSVKKEQTNASDSTKR